MLLSFPIQRRYIEYLISLVVSSLKCLLHLQDINLKGKTHNMHGDHLAKGDIYPCFPLWQHLVLAKDHSRIDSLLLNNLILLSKYRLSMGWAIFETDDPWMKGEFNNWQANWHCKIIQGWFNIDLHGLTCWGHYECLLHLILQNRKRAVKSTTKPSAKNICENKKNKKKKKLGNELKKREKTRKKTIALVILNTKSS